MPLLWKKALARRLWFISGMKILGIAVIVNDSRSRIPARQVFQLSYKGYKGNRVIRSAFPGISSGTPRRDLKASGKPLGWRNTHLLIPSSTLTSALQGGPAAAQRVPEPQNPGLVQRLDLAPGLVKSHEIPMDPLLKLVQVPLKGILRCDNLTTQLGVISKFSNDTLDSTVHDMRKKLISPGPNIDP
ncbi:hypothetical protein TURU_068324 [Turdus rufiventris]|nr:hypothetical protein TURU_068324 [Turdus rufiventris]